MSIRRAATVLFDSPQVPFSRRAPAWFAGAALGVMAIGCAHLPVAQSESAVAQRSLAVSYGNVPISFVANQGQTDERVKFLARGQGYSLFLTPAEAVLTLRASSRAAAEQRAAVVRMRLV